MPGSFPGRSNVASPPRDNNFDIELLELTGDRIVDCRRDFELRNAAHKGEDAGPEVLNDPQMNETFGSDSKAFEGWDMKTS